MQHLHPVDSSGSEFIPTVPLFVRNPADFVPMIPRTPKAYPEVPKLVPLVPAKEEDWQPNDEDPNDKAPQSFPAPMALKLVRKKPFDVTQSGGYLQGTQRPRKWWR